MDAENSWFGGWKGLWKTVTPVPRRCEYNSGRSMDVGGADSFFESFLNFRDYGLET